MKSTIRLALTGIGALLIAACASTTEAPSTSSSATLSVEGVSAAYNGAVANGKGTLNYQGQIHHFTMTGLGAGGTGAQKVSATGEVHNLNSLADFAGIYKGASKGLTVIKGTMTAKMTNEHGVVVYLSGERQGAASNTGVRAFKITLTD